MSEPKPSAWVQARFGDMANDLARAVSRAVYQAHEQALAAHVNGGLQSNDAYGSTMYPAVNERLAAECADIPGVQLRKPKGTRGRFDLVVCEQPPVVLYPWRYATDKAVTRERARFRRPVSDLRKTLLALNEGTIAGQLTLEQGARDPGELEAELAEEQAILDQLEALGLGGERWSWSTGGPAACAGPTGSRCRRLGAKPWAAGRRARYRRPAETAAARASVSTTPRRRTIWASSYGRRWGSRRSASLSGPRKTPEAATSRDGR